MDVHDAVETRSEDTLEVDDMDLRLEGSHTVDWLLGGAEDETLDDIFFFDASDTETDLVTAGSNVDFFLGFGVDGDDFDGGAAGHHEEGAALLDDTGFDLAFDDSSHVLVFGGDGHEEWGVDLAVRELHVVQVVEEGGAVVPVADFFGDWLAEVVASEGGDWHELEV